MKRFFLLAALVASSMSATPQDLSKEPDPKGWYVPQANGQFTYVSRKTFESRSSDVKEGNVKYYLYTKTNPNTPKQLFLDNISALSRSSFNGSKPTRVIIHGWLNDYKSEVNKVLRTAFLNTTNSNVIVVDWNDVAKYTNYISVRLSIADVGKQIAKFLNFLNKKGGMSFSNLVVVGHSLGAHIGGYAGRNTRGKIKKIVGLDPAYPLFTFSNCSRRLCKTDATYVESIHTSGGMLGFLQPIGMAAFYPNGGEIQPGCGVDTMRKCSHSRAYLYYAEAIQRDNFKSMSCSSYLLAVKKKCTDKTTVRMGTGFGNSGVFYVPVNAKPPYGKG